MKKDHEKNLPKIDDIQDEYPNKIYYIIFSIFYLVFYCGITKMLMRNSGWFNNITLKCELIANFVLMGIMAAVLIFLFRKRLKRDAVLLFKNIGTYLKYNLHIFGKYIGFYILGAFSVALILFKLTEDATSTNEAVLSTIPLWVTFILGVFAAPIVEEGMFRWIPRKVTDKKVVYILLSGFIFGLIHVNYWGMQEWIRVIQIIPYSIIGIMLAEIYYNTKNLLASSLFHATWNAIMIILEALLLYLQTKV